MSKLKNLSPNLITILSELDKNQRLKKLLHYNEQNPTMQSNVKGTLVMKKLFPYPFDINHVDSQLTNVMAYYPEASLRGKNIEEIALNIDVIVHRNLYLINESGESLVRPYEAISEIADTFHEKSIEKLGIINIHGFERQTVNANFDAYQIIATITQFTSRSK